MLLWSIHQRAKDLWLSWRNFWCLTSTGSNVLVCSCRSSNEVSQPNHLKTKVVCTFHVPSRWAQLSTNAGCKVWYKKKRKDTLPMLLLKPISTWQGQAARFSASICCLQKRSVTQPTLQQSNGLSSWYAGGPTTAWPGLVLTHTMSRPRLSHIKTKRAAVVNLLRFDFCFATRLNKNRRLVLGCTDWSWGHGGLPVPHSPVRRSVSSG